MSDQQAQELRECVEEMLPYMENHPRSHAQRLAEHARSILAVQVERSDPLSTRIGTEGPLRRLPEQPDEGEAAADDLNDGRDRQVRGAGNSDATKSAPGLSPAVAAADYATGPPSLPCRLADEGITEAMEDAALFILARSGITRRGVHEAIRDALAARPVVSEENPA